MDITALGELLIDFTPAGLSARGNPLFERNPGGAVANVAAAAARLGSKSAFIGKVGDDAFGAYLRDVLHDSGVDVSGLKKTSQAVTTLAFVHLDAGGDRSFSFCRKPGADILLGEDEVDTELIARSRVFHFGSLSLTNEPARTATLRAARFAKEQGVTVSYDPNWRPPLWPDTETAKRWMLEGLAYAGLVKLSREELALLTGCEGLAQGSAALCQKGADFVAVTLGPDGCFYRRGELTGLVPTYDVKVLDTTGAGDAFWGAALSRMTKPGFDIKRADKAALDEVVAFANAAGAFCASGYGAISSLADETDIRRVQTLCPPLK